MPVNENEPENTEPEVTATPSAEDATEAGAASETADAVSEPEAAAINESAEDSPQDSPGDSPGDSPWAGVGENTTARIEELEAQTAELNDKLLRALAEAENVRRRAQRDREDASKFAIKNFALGMLSVADNLGRALASIDADARAADANLENLYVGVDMVSRELVTTFERYGVTPIKALGAKFDPMLHEAMFEIEDKESPAGTIAQVLEPGYVLNGRTLRAAKVGITKGGLKEAPAPAPKAEPVEAPDTAEPTDPATRDGQAAYESQADPKDLSGNQLDEEL